MLRAVSELLDPVLTKFTNSMPHEEYRASSILDLLVVCAVTPIISAVSSYAVLP